MAEEMEGTSLQPVCFTMNHNLNNVGVSSDTLFIRRNSTNEVTTLKFPRRWYAAEDLVKTFNRLLFQHLRQIDTRFGVNLFQNNNLIIPQATEADFFRDFYRYDEYSNRMYCEYSVVFNTIKGLLYDYTIMKINPRTDAESILYSMFGLSGESTSLLLIEPENLYIIDETAPTLDYITTYSNGVDDINNNGYHTGGYFAKKFTNYTDTSQGGGITLTGTIMRYNIPAVNFTHEILQDFLFFDPASRDLVRFYAKKQVNLRGPTGIYISIKGLYGQGSAVTNFLTHSSSLERNVSPDHFMWLYVPVNTDEGGVITKTWNDVHSDTVQQKIELGSEIVVIFYDDNGNALDCDEQTHWNLALIKHNI